MSGIGQLALYVHIPFCETKCPYCDFNTYAGIDGLIPSYVGALCREIIDWGNALNHPEVKSVFFGGGTPSYLPSEEINLIMRSVESAFGVVPMAEITLEANPGDLTPSKLEAYLESGINRVSIGVQSLSDRLLGLLGRRHSALEAVNAYRMSLASGFENISIDLMYGLPHQSLHEWEETLKDAVGLNPYHISMYCLTLEEGTPMERHVKSGQLPNPDSDLAADMYLNGQDRLGRLGYRHYEISNWALPGFESSHNMTYWCNQPYLGVGPGAHSYLSGFRFFNIKSPREYLQRFSIDGLSRPRCQVEINAETIGSMEVVEEVEKVDRSLEMAETLMMGLRLDTGVDDEEFIRRFGVTPSQVYESTIKDLTSVGLIEIIDGSTRLTSRGRMLGNEVFGRVLSERIKCSNIS